MFNGVMLVFLGQHDYKGKRQNDQSISRKCKRLSGTQRFRFALSLKSNGQICPALPVGGAGMAKAHESRHLSIFINRDTTDVYDFVFNPENFPRWASGLGKSLKKVHDGCVAETPAGSVKVRFTERNEFGVLDHWLTLTPEQQIYIPMRVIPNGGGCEFIFTLFRLPDMSDEKFASDAEWVMRDLAALKMLLEAK